MKYHLNILSELHFNANRQSSALGTDPIRTLVRAGNEAYEKCAAAFRGDELHKISTKKDLGPDAILNTSLFPLTIDTNHTIEELPDTEPIAWVPAWSLSHKKVRWIPAPHCYFEFPSGRNYAQGHTRGLAAGPTLDFCTYKGLAELIETLGATRWRSVTKKVPEVVLPSFGDPLFDSIKSHHEDKGREIWVLDISNYLELPFFIFAAISYDRKKNNLVHGTAASHTPQRAIRSALLECTQMLPNLQRSPEEQATSRSVAFGLESYHERGAVTRGAAYYAGKEHASLTLHELVHELLALDIEVIVKDLTRKEVPIRVARVMFCMSE